MTRYYIFRHGDTWYTKNRQSYPVDNFSVEILPDSIPALEKIAKYLKDIHSDFNISSEYVRCQQSNKIVSKISGLIFKNDARLNEFSHEEFDNLVERLESFVNEIKEREYKTIVVCTHGAVIAGLKNILIGSEYEKSEMIDYPRPGVLTIIEGTSIKEIDFN
ncbi:MAG TPA: histidine phosphatase family protein [Candidatus Methanoperedens sp.]|nr:histidine phosphatase family protein [Candidatus Methanoperedens sp.]